MSSPRSVCRRGYVEERESRGDRNSTKTNPRCSEGDREQRRRARRNGDKRGKVDASGDGADVNVGASEAREEPGS